MDHALQMISYIADIGDIVVLMARRKRKGQEDDTNSNSGTQKKCIMICHVFSSEDVSSMMSFNLSCKTNSYYNIITVIRTPNSCWCR